MDLKISALGKLRTSESKANFLYTVCCRPAWLKNYKSLPGSVAHAVPALGRWAAGGF